MSQPLEQLYAGDIVRANTGRGEGRIGKALRVVEHAGLPTTVLVKFIDGRLCYCPLKSLSNSVIGDRSMESVGKVNDNMRSNEELESNSHEQHCHSEPCLSC